jgi:hypothetical protein
MQQRSGHGVVDYDPQRTEGLTDADMVEAISAIYGPALHPSPTTRGTIARIADESGPRVAGWGDAECAVVLYRSLYASGFRLIVTSPRLDALARSADERATMLDEQDAPRRARQKDKEQADAARAMQDKARQANKAGFRP